MPGASASGTWGGYGYGWGYAGPWWGGQSDGASGDGGGSSE